MESKILAALLSEWADRLSEGLMEIEKHLADDTPRQERQVYTGAPGVESVADAFNPEKWTTIADGVPLCFSDIEAVSARMQKLVDSLVLNSSD